MNWTTLIKIELESRETEEKVRTKREKRYTTCWKGEENVRKGEKRKKRGQRIPEEAEEEKDLSQTSSESRGMDLSLFHIPLFYCISFPFIRQDLSLFLLYPVSLQKSRTHELPDKKEGRPGITWTYTTWTTQTHRKEKEGERLREKEIERGSASAL